MSEKEVNLNMRDIDNEIFNSTRKKEIRSFVKDKGGAQSGPQSKRRMYSTRCVGDVTSAAISIPAVKVKGIEFPFGPEVFTFEKKSLAFPYKCETCDAELYFDSEKDAKCPHCAELGEITKVTRVPMGRGVPKTQKYHMVDEMVVGLARRICSHKNKPPLTVKLRRAAGIEVLDNGKRRAKYEEIDAYAEDVLEMWLIPSDGSPRKEVDWSRTAKANKVIFVDTSNAEYNSIIQKYKFEYIESDMALKLKELRIQDYEWRLIYDEYGIVDGSYMEKWMAAQIYKRYSGKNIDDDDRKQKPDYETKYDSLTVAKLKTECTDRGLDFDVNTRKQGLIDILLEDDEE